MTTPLPTITDPVEGLELADVLDRVADRLSKPAAWMQVGGRNAGRRGCTCIGLALMDEARSSPSLRHALINALTTQLGISASLPHIYSWNDAKGRTKKEVIQALREAAAAARGAS